MGGRAAAPTGTPSDAARPPIASADGAQALRFERFVTWTIRVFWVFVPLDIGIAIVTRDPGSAGLASTLVVIFALLHLSRSRVRHGALNVAVTIAAAAILVPIPLLAVFRPQLFPVLAMGSILSVSAAVPFVDAARLRLHAWAAAAVTVVVIAIGVTLTDPAPGPLPAAYAETTFAAALGFVIALILFMLVKFSGRLRDTLDETERARARVEKANDELRRLDDLKTQFMNNAAHELNTPLTPIRLQLHLLQAKGDAMTPAERKRALGILDRSVARVELLVRDLLDATRLQAGRFRMDRRATDMAEIVRDRLESFHDAARGAGITLAAEVDGPVPVTGDPERLGQVVDVFLTNALKFTGRGGAIRVRLAADGGHASVTVQDDGVGIHDHDLGQLFRPFTQVGAGQEVRGTGLGLFIAKGIAEQHGGSVWAASPGLGKGSTFGLVVPRLAGAPATPAAVSDLVTGPSGPTAR